MKRGTIYCEYSGAVREAFRKLGWDMWSCDLLPAEDGSPYHVQDDATSIVIVTGLHDKLAGIHWPCTYFTNSGVRWMKVGGRGDEPDMDRRQKMVDSAVGLSTLLYPLLQFGVPFYFENPVMFAEAKAEIASRLRHPWFGDTKPQTIQPWMFGHWETKRTCLWLHKLPPLVPTYRTETECRIALGLPEFVLNRKGELVKNRPEAKCHRMSPGKDRGHERSRTLPGIAAAFAAQWGNLA